jgi:hypothetical protein
MTTRRPSRRRQAGSALVGLAVCLLVTGTGWRFLRTEHTARADLDQAEQRAAAAKEEPRALRGGVDDLSLPEDPPFTLPGWVLEYRIVANAPQAAAFGLLPERARSWGFVLASDDDNDAGNDTGSDPDPLRARGALIAAIEAGGGVLDEQQVEVPGSEFVTLTGTWNELLLLVNVHDWRSVTLTLLDR